MNYNNEMNIHNILMNIDVYFDVCKFPIDILKNEQHVLLAIQFYDKY